MDNESSLLAYLVPRLTSRGEDTATDALAFILNKSEACRGALDSLLSDQDFGLGPLTRFDTTAPHQGDSRQLKRSTIMFTSWPPPTHIDSRPTVLSPSSRPLSRVYMNVQGMRKQIQD